MKTELFDFPEHIIRCARDKDKLFFEILPRQPMSFLKRILLAIQYLFGYKNIHASLLWTFESTEVKKLNKLLEVTERKEKMSKVTHISEGLNEDFQLIPWKRDR